MNRNYILYNLKDALKQLTEIVNELENNTDYEFGEYSVDMQHLYHHVNTAWNARETSIEESNKCSKYDFEKWRQFPVDIYMGS